MTARTPPLTVDELAAAARSGEIDTVAVAFTDHYGRAMGKRFDAGFFLDEVVGAGTHGCDYLLTVDMEMEPVPGYRYASWELGYGDFHLVPDLATLCRAGWTDRTAFVLCDIAGGDGSTAGGDGSTAGGDSGTAGGDSNTADTADHADHELVAIAPRTILRRQLERLDALGRRAMAASELEYFLYRDTYREAHERGHADLSPAGLYIEDYHLLQGARVEPYVGEARRALQRSGIPVESSKGEWGRGQHEINVRYAEALTMADRHAVMKYAMKELADRVGVSLTFMAKPHTGEAGSSCHIHLSLWDAEAATPVFAGADGPSDEFRWFLAGWMAHVRDVMVWYAPTINSYKRYVDGSWAPTRIAWSRDNRTAGFRVVGSGPSLRIECRIPGADCNPYLAYAASIASGIAGIEARMEPPPMFVGDVYQAQDLPRVARTLHDAVADFADSAMARAAFGDDVVDHYTHFCEVEVRAFDTAVTDWERRRYFEQI